MTNLPQKFVDRINEDYGAEQAAALCAALDSESPTSVRLNPFKSGGELDVLKGSEPVGWSANGYYLPERPSFTLDSDFHAGAYYVQEAGSQFVGHLLSKYNLEGARLLDLCAAPGGKTTLYSTLVGEDGLVLANEINRSRAMVLSDNIRKWGIGNVVVSNNTPAQISAFESWFDVVAVDAPCSGEGMFRKMDLAREEWSESSVWQCAERQREIIEEAWRNLRPGGTLIYSTCTFNRLENEGLLENFLQEFEDEVVETEGIECCEEWGITRGRVGAFQTFRFFPHKAKGEGFFAAIARKSDDMKSKSRTPKARRKIMQTVDRQSIAECSRWVQNPDKMQFAMVVDTIYGYSKSTFEDVKSLAEALNVVYSGVAMGQIFKGKLKPDPALALYYALDAEVVAVAEFDKEEILSYLRKGDLPADRFCEGMNLVKANGYAVGFAKRIGARVNNLYPNSLRILK